MHYDDDGCRTKVYLTVCKDIPARAQILAAQSRKFTLAADVDLHTVAARLPATVTGADIGAVSSSAYSKALARRLDALKARTALALAARDHASSAGAAATVKRGQSPWAVAAHLDSLPAEELVVTVTPEDFYAAAEAVKPSVSPEELAHYESLGAAFNDMGEEGR